MQQQLREMNFYEPTLTQHPNLLGAQLESSEHEQFDSAQEDTKEDEGEATSALDAELDVSTGKETDASGHPQLSGAAEGFAPCKGSILGHVGSFGGPRIGVLVFHCFGELPRKMPSPIEIGAVRLKTP